jgi:hypothetical protein
MRRRIIAVAAAAAAVGASLMAQPASADATYHSSHIALASQSGDPLRSGFVQNIHPNGPIVFAHEVYVLNGATPRTTYDVELQLFPLDPSCAGAPVTVPSASFTTNQAGNGRGDVFFSPADAAGLRNGTHGIIWNVSDSSGVAYSTGCQVVTLD